VVKEVQEEHAHVDVNTDGYYCQWLKGKEKTYHQEPSYNLEHIIKHPHLLLLLVNIQVLERNAKKSLILIFLKLVVQEFPDGINHFQRDVETQEDRYNQKEKIINVTGAS